MYVACLIQSDVFPCLTPRLRFQGFHHFDWRVLIIFGGLIAYTGEIDHPVGEMHTDTNEASKMMERQFEL